jgi:hypothetical protein
VAKLFVHAARLFTVAKNGRFLSHYLHSENSR